MELMQSACNYLLFDIPWLCWALLVAGSWTGCQFRQEQDPDNCNSRLCHICNYVSSKQSHYWNAHSYGQWWPASSLWKPHCCPGC